MKRKFLLMACSTAFLTATSIVAWCLQFFELNFWTSFWVGVGILIFGILLLIIYGKSKFTKYLVVVTNAISMGFLLRAWYVNRGFNNSIWLLLFVVVLAELYFLLAILPLTIGAVAKRKGLYLTIFVLASLVGFCFLVHYTTTTWVSTLGYFGLTQLGFVICLALDEKQNLEKTLLASTYTVAICAVIILIIAVGADDVGSVFDGVGGGSDNGSKSRKTKSPTQDDLIQNNQNNSQN